MPALDQLDQLVHDRAGRGDAVVASIVSWFPRNAAQAVAQRLEHTVADTRELGRDLVRD